MSPVPFLCQGNGMSKSLEKSVCDALLDVLKSLSNLSWLLDCSDCFDCSVCLSYENIPLSNVLNAIALFNMSSFTYFTFRITL